MPSTLLNIMDLLGDYKSVVKNNNDISIFYIFYQFWIMVSTFVGPGTLFIMVAGAFANAFELPSLTCYILNVVPILLFIIVCFVAKPDTQIIFAQLLTIGYGLMMIVVFIGMFLQIGKYGYGTPTVLLFIFILSYYVFAGILHPRVFFLLFDKS